MNILHCDLDAFYAAVEQRDNPHLQGKPVIIGGRSESRGVVATCSYEARKYGVHSAMPVSQAYRLCPHGTFLPPDIKKYHSVSRQVFEIFTDYTPTIEPLSIDEAFLDISGCHKLFGSSQEVGILIRKRIKNEIGLNISIGIADNKFLAKLATNLCKPDGILLFDANMIQNTLPKLPVSSLWSVGSKTARCLNRAGIYTAGDLANISPEKLQRIVGSNASFLIALAQGHDQRPVCPRSDAKSMGNEITFPIDLSDPAEIDQVILELSSQVGFRLRQSELKACTVHLKLRTPDFTTVTRSRTLGNAIDADLVIYNIASDLYRQSGLTGKPLRLTGINCSNLIPCDLEQPALFEKSSDRLDNIIDELKNSFAGAKISRASLMEK